MSLTGDHFYLRASACIIMNHAEFEYLGPYRVERLLGRGGMGSVYKGIHAKSGDAVAIKVIASSIANHSRFRRRFASEIEALKRLKHPHIVELIGYGEEKGMLFYSMEFVDGHSLHDHLRQHGSLSWEEVLQVGIETSGALKHAHNIGIIHRDLKPANLMLNQDGHVKLTDFGISKLFGAGDETAVGSIIGTADYMPPEQAEGKPVNVRSDLYSLGCVLYSLLAGQAPFSGKSVPEVLYSVRYNPVPNLASLAPKAPQELVDLIHELLEKDPLKRPPTALVVGNRLKALQQGLERRSSKGLPGVPSDESAADAQHVVGSELTSLDLSDVDDNELKLTGEAPSPEEEPSLASETQASVDEVGTHEQQTILAPQRDTGATTDDVRSAPRTSAEAAVSQPAAEPRQSDHELSLADGVSSEFHSLASRESSVSTTGPSHYTPVSQMDARRYSLGGHEATADTGFDWLQMGSMAGIVALLLGSVAVAWWMLQPSSADDIYATITAAVDSGDDGQLLSVRADIDEFLERFPDDERLVEVQALADEAELVRRVKLLQRKAAQVGGAQELSAIEQAFLDCLQTRAKDVALAREKFTAFLSVFGQLENLEPGERRLVELAQFAKRAGERLPLQPAPAAQAQLETLIQSAEKALPAQRLQRYYEDLLLLYADKPWADEQMQRIRKKMQREPSG